MKILTVNPTGRDLDRARRLILATSFSSNLFANITMTGANVALPALERDLSLSAAQLGWVNLSLLMAMAVATVPLIRLADIFGRRRLGLAGLFLSLAGSLICGLAWSSEILLIGRAVSGLGMAALFLTVLAMLASLAPPEHRGRYLGYSISAVYLGLSLGPFLSGLLVEGFGWRYLFWFSALSFLLPLTLLWLLRVEQLAAPEGGFDLRGAVWWMLAVIATFVGLAHLDRGAAGWLPLAGGLLAMAGFARFSLRSAVPLIDVRLFIQNRSFLYAALASLICFCTSMGAVLLISLYLQYVRGFSPREAGLVLMVQPVAQTMITPLAGRLSDRLDPGVLASAGLGCSLAALLIYTFWLTPVTPIVLVALTMVLFGVGMALFNTSNSNALMSAVPHRQAAQASGIINITRLCGQMTSLSLVTLSLSLALGPGLISPERYPDFMHAMDFCFIIFLPMSLLAILASLARMRPRVSRP